jgi:hypothetical protein
MKIALLAAAICAVSVLAIPAMAQFAETGGVSSQTGPTAKGAVAGTGGAALNTSSPARNGTSAHDNTRGITAPALRMDQPGHLCRMERKLLQELLRPMRRIKPKRPGPVLSYGKSPYPAEQTPSNW